MKPVPYYDQDGITIYHGDCAQVLPFLDPVDLLLTDPPYGIGEHGGACRTRGRPGYKKHERLSNWDNSIPPRFILEMSLSKSKHAVVWGGNYFTESLPPKMGWLYWQKLMGGDFSDGELAWTSRDGALKEYTKCPKGMDKEHPCQKPIGLMGWCIELFTDVESILDPFMGSGTTLVAAKNHGKRCIGIEREEKYCKIAVERLGQQSLFQQSNASVDRAASAAQIQQLVRQLPNDTLANTKKDE